MANVEAASREPRPKVGRPPRINRQMIAEAAHEIGLDGLTLKAVADHLDVSIAALYHHVTGKDDLMRVAAEYSAARVPLPQDHGQHWAVWLYQWAVYNRDVFLAQPGLLAQYLEGAISAEAIAGNVDVILGVLVRQGYSILDANDAYELVTSCALGTAVATLREREASEVGQPSLITHPGVVARMDAGDLPYLQALVAEIGDHRRSPFDARIATVLRGIALGHGEDWEPIAARLADAP
jgi:AcrR family transcriptional regulator